MDITIPNEYIKYYHDIGIDLYWFLPNTYIDDNYHMYHDYYHLDRFNYNAF